MRIAFSPDCTGSPTGEGSQPDQPAVRGRRYCDAPNRSVSREARADTANEFRCARPGLATDQSPAALLSSDQPLQFGVHPRSPLCLVFLLSRGGLNIRLDVHPRDQHDHGEGDHKDHPAQRRRRRRCPERHRRAEQESCGQGCQPHQMCAESLDARIVHERSNAPLCLES